MKAPKIFVVIKRIRDLEDTIVGWSFDEREARDEARRLNSFGEWGPHVVEGCAPIGEQSSDEYYRR